MSIAEFYVEHGIGPDWDAPGGMEGFLARHVDPEDPPHAASAKNETRKRGRGDSEDDTEGNHNPYAEGSGSATSPTARPAKRPKQKHEALVTFDAPFPCAFRDRCRFRATCSYHHGLAQPCLCDSPQCPRGHPHRRAPRPCVHGSIGDCRWARLRECSFHHGVATTCTCDEGECPRAHPHRVRRRADVRSERRKEMIKDRPELAEENTRKLFLGMPGGDEAVGIATEADVQSKLGEFIRMATPPESQPATSDQDPIQEVRIDPERGFAFVKFRTAELATACLAMDGLRLAGWGKMRLERPRDYDAAAAPDAAGAVTLDTSKLDRMPDRNVKEEKENKDRKKSGKTKSHYRMWRTEQKARKTGETNQQLRERYVLLFPDKK